MTEQDIREKLRAIKYPGFTRDIVSFGLIKAVHVDDKRCEVRLSMITQNADVIGEIVGEVERTLSAVAGLPPVDVIVERPETEPATRARQMATALGSGPRGVPGVARIIAVASGKGGVGKSTVAANLAVALARLGYRVGLLDADIYGPSVPTMFGLTGSAKAGSDEEGRFIPVERCGVKLVSMGMFAGEGAPLIWRGPMLTKALGQFLGDVRWGNLDYLVLDLPPGTGDVQLTLIQQVALDGGVIVTTPQDVALADVERGVKMFRQAATPVLGVVENMSFHICPGCGRKSHIFGDGGGLKVAARHGVPLIGSIPLLRSIREGGDAGRPIVDTEPAGDVGRAFLALAERVIAEAPAREVGHA